MIFAQNAAPAADEVGMPFGDVRVVEALALCKLLEPHRKPLKLECIYVYPEAIDKQLGGFTSWVLEVATADNRSIMWGHTPGKESPDEPPVEEKVASIHAWLDSPRPAGEVAVLDLRHRRVPSRLTRTPALSNGAP